jgi:hypothetical protein
VKISVLTLLTAFVLLASSFTFSSCKSCNKKGGNSATRSLSDLSGSGPTTDNSNAPSGGGGVATGSGVAADGLAASDGGGVATGDGPAADSQAISSGDGGKSDGSKDGGKTAPVPLNKAEEKLLALIKLTKKEFDDGKKNVFEVADSMCSDVERIKKKGIVIEYGNKEHGNIFGNVINIPQEVLVLVAKACVDAAGASQAKIAGMPAHEKDKTPKYVVAAAHWRRATRWAVEAGDMGIAWECAVKCRTAATDAENVDKLNSFGPSPRMVQGAKDNAGAAEEMVRTGKIIV